MKKNKPVKEYREYWVVGEGLLFYKSKLHR